LKRQFNLTPLARKLIEVFLLAFLVFILPSWNSRSPLTAQTDPTKVSSEATASAQPTEIFPQATDPQFSNYEQAWHEAYRDVPYLGAYERAWFGAWWGRDEFTP
jgi:hypothetical protein